MIISTAILIASHWWRLWATSAPRVARVSCTESRYLADVHCIDRPLSGRSRDGLYEPALADSEREAVSDLLGYLENVRPRRLVTLSINLHDHQRGETDFFSGDPLRSLSTLVYSENVDLQRSASLTFAEITERGMASQSSGIHTYLTP